MPLIKRVPPKLLVAAYGMALVILIVVVIVLRPPHQVLMAMFVPIILAAVLYRQRLYVVMLPLLFFSYLCVLLYQGKLAGAAAGLGFGFAITVVVAEATHHLLASRERLENTLREREAVYRAVIEKSPLGITMRSRTGRLLSYNQAWQKIWAIPEDDIHRDMARERKELVLDQRDLHLGEGSAEVTQVYRRGGQAYLPELKTSGLRPGSANWVSQYFYAIQEPGGEVERVVIITEDISERKQMEQCEKENRVLSEALRDTAAALNSTLKLEEVLERILTNVGRVVPHDAVNIMLLKEGVASITRCQGYAERGLDEALKSLRLPLADMAFLRRMAEIGAPVFVADTYVEPDWVAIPETAWIHSYAGAPIRIKGELVGFLNLDSAQANFYTALHAEGLRAFADQAAIAIENARLYEEVQRLAIMDELTGVYNYRGLSELGQREVERSHRYNYPLAALFFDIDHFRIFNKQYTHSVGNLVLRAVAECSKARVRAVDLVARYGGEEFAILLTQTDASTALQVADRLRLDIENMRVATAYGILNVTVSIGVAELTEDVRDLAMLLDQADQAEHEAKQKGRNCVEMWVKP